jgi:hypothetical protein
MDETPWDQAAIPQSPQRSITGEEDVVGAGSVGGTEPAPAKRLSPETASDDASHLPLAPADEGERPGSDVHTRDAD